jgi:hypothetical protein
MVETPEQYVARLGLEPPPDPEMAKLWWQDVIFTMGDHWPRSITDRILYAWRLAGTYAKPIKF